MWATNLTAAQVKKIQWLFGAEMWDQALGVERTRNACRSFLILRHA